MSVAGWLLDLVQQIKDMVRVGAGLQGNGAQSVAKLFLTEPLQVIWSKLAQRNEQIHTYNIPGRQINQCCCCGNIAWPVNVTMKYSNSRSIVEHNI